MLRSSIQVFIVWILWNLITFEAVFGHPPSHDSSSAGCSSAQLPDGLRTDELTMMTINITDSRFNNSVIERHFYIRVPGTNDDSHSTKSTDMKSLMFYFHGFGGYALDVATKYEYNLMGRLEDVIMIYPEGISDLFYPNGTQETNLKGWNAVGASDNEATGCTSEMGYQCLYASCAELGQCHQCAFASCHDDVLFVQKLLEWALANLCVDTYKVTATGLSNGGMMTYELMSKYPYPFEAFVVVYGTPMQGFLNFSDPDVVGKPLLHIHGLYDMWVPYNGTLNYQNLTFTPAPDVVEEYARIQNCSLQSTVWETPFDTVNKFECMEYPNCQSGAMVVLCTYSGGHDYPPMIEEATYLFINEVKKRNEDKSTDFKNLLKSSSFFICALQVVMFYFM